MELLVRQKADKLIEIYKQLNSDYRWKNSSNMNNLIALSYVMKGKEYFRDDLDRVNTYIKQNTGPFSCYRQKSILFSALLFLDFSDPEYRFDVLLDYEERLKSAGFKSYTYRPVTAYTLLMTGQPAKADFIIAQSFEIFNEMKKNHPWLTSGDDYPLSILLAASNRSVSSIMAEIEDIYRSLNEVGFSKGNGLQFLSHVLGLSQEKNNEKALKCRRLYKYFQENKLKVYSGNYGSLGLLTLIEDEGYSAAAEVLALSKYLSQSRGIRWLGRETLFLTATSLVTFLKLENFKNNSELIQTNAFVTVEALMAAQNAAMLGATCAASTAATTS